MANFKNITDLPVAESAEGINLIVNDNGSAKQIAASAIGGGEKNTIIIGRNQFCINGEDIGCEIFPSTNMFVVGSIGDNFSHFTKDFFENAIVMGPTGSISKIVYYNVFSDVVSFSYVENDIWRVQLYKSVAP